MSKETKKTEPPMDKLDNLIITDTSDDDYTLLMSHVVCGEPELLFLDALLTDALRPQCQ